MTASQPRLRLACSCRARRNGGGVQGSTTGAMPGAGQGDDHAGHLGTRVGEAGRGERTGDGARIFGIEAVLGDDHPCHRGPSPAGCRSAAPCRQSGPRNSRKRPEESIRP